jgi:hypothetical protein
MSEVTAERARPVETYVEEIIDRIRQRYPRAVCQPRDVLYGDEDAGIDVYVPAEDVRGVREHVHRVAFEATAATKLLILPSVLAGPIPSTGA